ncbi:MAG TPA: threonine/serine exporter family protein [Kribbella sp.]|nr:threonine/serine exporter family protein [Kribbella sp.]
MNRTDADPFDVTVRLAALLLRSSGEGVVMLERYVARVSHAFGADIELLVLPEQVMVTDTGTGASSRVAVVKTTPGLSRLDQVMDLKVLVSDIEQGLSVSDASRRLEAIEAGPPQWPRWLRVVGVVLFTAGFAPSVVATAGEVVATVLLGTVMGVLLVSLEGRRFEALVPFIGAFLLTVIAAVFLSDLVSRTGVVLVVVPALFVVVPGDYLSAAAGELIGGRIAAGATRLIYAAFVLALLVVGIAAAAEITGGEDLLTETPVTPNLPFIAVVLAWIPFSIGLVLAFNATLKALPWLIPTVIGTYLIQQGATRLVGDITGTLLAGIALGTVAGIASRPANRPPRLVLVLGGFFVLTVGGLGLRGATALLGDDIISGFGDLRDFLVQMPTVAISLAIALIATDRQHPRHPLDRGPGPVGASG